MRSAERLRDKRRLDLEIRQAFDQPTGRPRCQLDNDFGEHRGAPAFYFWRYARRRCATAPRNIYHSLSGRPHDKFVSHHAPTALPASYLLQLGFTIRPPHDAALDCPMAARAYLPFVSHDPGRPFRPKSARWSQAAPNSTEDPFHPLARTFATQQRPITRTR
jgi:hypothetical protein